MRFKVNHLEAARMPDSPNLSLSTAVQVIADLSNLQYANEAQRISMRNALSTALAGIETPAESALRIITSQPAQLACLKICQDVGLFEKWAKSHETEPATVEELASLVPMESTLLSRLLRHLHTTHVVEQTSVDTYRLTKFSKALAAHGFDNIVPFCFNFTIPGFTNLPEFLGSTRYRNPVHDKYTNWHHMTGMSRFEELKQDAEKMAVFQAVMTINAQKRLHWTSIFPIDQLLSTWRPETPLLVDVGGGAGYDIEVFRQRLEAKNVPIPSNALVLQDMKTVVDTAIVSEPISVQEHDIFTPQPVEGAAAYYLHTVLHDWTNEQANSILTQLAKAARPGYSRILIHEIIVMDDPSVEATSIDMEMMMCHNTCERTESMWREVVEKAGLSLVKIWAVAGAQEAVIEAVLPGK